MSTRTTSTRAVTSVDAGRLSAGRVADAWRRLTTRIGDSFSRQALNRRVVERLSHLSEHDLADIGLTPSDVADAALSENGDATRFLVARRDARRAAQYGRYPF